MKFIYKLVLSFFLGISLMSCAEQSLDAQVPSRQMTAFERSIFNQCFSDEGFRQSFSNKQALYKYCNCFSNIPDVHGAKFRNSILEIVKLKREAENDSTVANVKKYIDEKKKLKSWAMQFVEQQSVKCLME